MQYHEAHVPINAIIDKFRPCTIIMNEKPLAWILSADFEKDTEITESSFFELEGSPVPGTL
jgi:hypothetical protein